MGFINYFGISVWPIW